MNKHENELQNMESTGHNPVRSEHALSHIDSLLGHNGEMFEHLERI